MCTPTTKEDAVPLPQLGDKVIFWNNQELVSGTVNGETIFAEEPPYASYVSVYIHETDKIMRVHAGNITEIKKPVRS
jgi:hypothetical protein